jgi:hypothetical protein
MASAAERMRTHRRRRRKGLHCLMIFVHASEIDDLVRLGLLREEHRNDEYAIRRALSDLILQARRKA